MNSLKSLFKKKEDGHAGSYNSLLGEGEGVGDEGGFGSSSSASYVPPRLEGGAAQQVQAPDNAHPPTPVMELNVSETHQKVEFLRTILESADPFDPECFENDLVNELVGDIAIQSNRCAEWVMHLSTQGDENKLCTVLELNDSLVGVLEQHASLKDTARQAQEAGVAPSRAPPGSTAHTASVGMPAPAPASSAPLPSIFPAAIGMPAPAPAAGALDDGSFDLLGLGTTPSGLPPSTTA